MDPLDAARVNETQSHLEACLPGAGAVTAAVEQHETAQQHAPSASVNQDNTELSTRTWSIKFKPHEDNLESANDPLYVLRELSAMGDLNVSVDCSAVPPVLDMDPERIYLAWQIELVSDAARDEIDAVFEWIEGECDLTITEIPDPAASAAPTATAAVASATTAVSTPNTESATDEATPAAGKKPAASRQTNSDSSSIRVAIEKVDSVINLVGELVITQSMLSRFGEDETFNDFDGLRQGLMQLDRNTRELQQTVMQIRMLPISFSFNRFPRVVRDISGKLNKNVVLQIEGDQTELDKTVMEKIGDPLMHLVRNSLDHGIEMPEGRRAAGKDETGVLKLNAYHAGGNIVIEVSDDGQGLPRAKLLKKARDRGLVKPDEELTDDQVHNLIFHPGFSTAENISEISGRGVGMDVVKRNIQDLGGNVEVESVEGKGCTFRIRLPLTLAILDGQLIRVGESIYVISLVSIVESTQITAADVSSIAGHTEVYRLRDEYIPVLRLHETFGLETNCTELEDGLLVVVEANGIHVGLFVDDLLGQQQVVIKSLETNFRQVDGISGGTILGDGTVALIIDAPSLVTKFIGNGDTKHLNVSRSAA